MKKLKILVLIIWIITTACFGIYNKNSKMIKDYLELKNINYKYLANQYIQINNVPYEPQEHQIQGKFKITDIKDEVIMDMNLPNEEVPHGAQARQKVSGWFPFDDISMPSVCNYINPWGQVFIIDGQEYPKNAKVHIKNLAIACYRKSTQSWEIINEPHKIYGAFYKENYSDQSEQKAKIKSTNNGIIVDIDSSSEGRCFHFWTPAVKINDPSDILYVTTYCDAWINGNGTERKFVFNVGGDYRKRVDGEDSVKEIIGGRFKILGTKIRRTYATNLAYDKYFTICNQSIIDSLQAEK